jgi:hypothetical protein
MKILLVSPEYNKPRGFEEYPSGALLTLELTPDYYGVAAAFLLPNTQFYRIARANGYLFFKSYAECNFGQIVVRTDELSADDIHQALRYIKKALTVAEVSRR